VARLKLSEPLWDLLAAANLQTSSLPLGVRSVGQAAFNIDTPSPLRALAKEWLLLFGSDSVPARRLSSAKASPSVPQCDDDAVLEREISRLRAVLPKVCEFRMLGSQEAYLQAAPWMRRDAILRKLKSAGGRRGRAWARDRRALERYLDFCKAECVQLKARTV